MNVFKKIRYCDVCGLLFVLRLVGVCPSALIDICLFSETCSHRWAGTLLFLCLFLRDTTVVTLVCTAMTTCHFETVQMHLCVSISIGVGRDLRSYGASIPLTPSILFHCFFKSLNYFFPSTSKEGASFVMVNESYVLDGRRPLHNLHLLLFFHPTIIL